MASPTNTTRPETKPRNRLVGWKAWAARIGLLVGSPLLFLLLTEGVLALFGFGQSTEFYVPHRTADEIVHVSNQEFCKQFVPDPLARAPEQIELTAKQDDVLRVFVLGGSAAAGDPAPEFGFSRVLEVLLNEMAQGPQRFEVVNAGVTSMNSHVVRRIAADCATQQPDVFIVYMGNNEVVGPYGPPAVPGMFYGSTTYIRSAIGVRGSRIGQLVRSLGRSETEEKTWQGMEGFLEQAIPLDSPELAHCYSHFAANLSDVVDSGVDSGAKVLVSTVPTNITTCAPFGSSHGTELSGSQLETWKQHFEAGRLLQKKNRFSQALEEFASAAELDDEHAGLVFAMATCAWKAGDAEQAGKHYRRARDLDTLRFRADSRINETIRDVVAQLDSGDVTLLDLAKSLDCETPPPTVDADRFVDHVHLSLRGNVDSALLAVGVLSEMMPDAKLRKPSSVFDADAFVRQRLLYDEFAEYDVWLEMYRRKTRAPFSGQLDHEEEMTAARDHLVELINRRKSVENGSRLDKYRSAHDTNPSDAILLRRRVELLMNHGDHDTALRLAEDQLKARPYRGDTRRLVAECLARLDRTDEALSRLTASDNPYPTSKADALHFVGTALIRHGPKERVGDIYRELLKIDPQHVDAQVNLAAWEIGNGQPEKAIETLNAALEIAPHRADIYSNLGNAYVKLGDIDEAERCFRKAVEEDPTSHLAHAGLALRLAKLGQPRPAMQHLERAVYLMPEFPLGYHILALMHQQFGNHRMASRYQELARVFAP